MIYDIYDLKTNGKVGQLDERGSLIWANETHRQKLQRVIGRELLTRERGEPDEPGFGEVIEEGEMCYMGLQTVRPGDPDYLVVLIRQLPFLSDYEVRTVG